MDRGLVFALIVAVGVWLVAILVLVAAGQRSRARELATLVPNLLVLFRGLLRDPRVPRSSKLWLGFAVVWIASPIDLIPEFVPVAGPLDDAIVAALVLRHVLRRADRSVLLEHWKGDPATLEALVRARRRSTLTDESGNSRKRGRSRLDP
ncbi:MAG: YkvA family protein [Actinomycetota bacterium]